MISQNYCIYHTTTHHTEKIQYQNVKFVGIQFHDYIHGYLFDDF